MTFFHVANYVENLIEKFVLVKSIRLFHEVRKIYIYIYIYKYVKSKIYIYIYIYIYLAFYIFSSYLFINNLRKIIYYYPKIFSLFFIRLRIYRLIFCVTILIRSIARELSTLLIYYTKHFHVRWLWQNSF